MAHITELSPFSRFSIGEIMSKKKFLITPLQLIKTVAPLVFVALFTIVSYSIMISILINENVKNASGKGIVKVENQILSIIDPEITNLQTISDIAAITQEKDSLLLLLKNASAQSDTILAYYYASIKSLQNGGYLIMSDDWQAPSTFDQTTRPWFTGAIDLKGDIYASDIYINARSNSKCISFSKAVYNSLGQAVGIVGFDLDLEQLSAELGNIKVSESSSMCIVTSNGTYMTNFQDPKKIVDGNLFKENGFDLNGVELSEFLHHETQTINAGSSYWAMGQIKSFPWFVVVQGNRSDFTAKHMLWAVIILILTGLLIFACVALNVWDANRTSVKEKDLGDKLFGETQNLVVAAKENAATGQDQSAAVKEIVATMEDNNELSSNISQKIQDVSKVADKTTADVLDGVSALNINVEKLHEIFEANQNTIEGIKTLGDKIENIWDIVTLINSVADQAKIIAFNAELEASSAGEAGKNFHIVATEIRRLADGIISGTKEIKEKITEIQQSSDSLILASESGTEKINEGCASAKELENKFNSIKDASEITAESAKGITTIIQQQALASDQILITLKQIAAGVENFSTATENISNSAQTLQSIASQLTEAHKGAEDTEVPSA